MTISIMTLGITEKGDVVLLNALPTLLLLWSVLLYFVSLRVEAPPLAIKTTQWNSAFLAFSLIIEGTTEKVL